MFVCVSCWYYTTSTVVLFLSSSLWLCHPVVMSRFVCMLYRWLAFFALLCTDVLWILVNKSSLTQWFFYWSCECIAVIAMTIFICCWLCSAYCTSAWEISPSWQSSLRVLVCPFVVYVFFVIMDQGSCWCKYALICQYPCYGVLAYTQWNLTTFVDYVCIFRILIQKWLCWHISSFTKYKMVDQQAIWIDTM